MSTRNSKQVLRDLKNGKLPDELNFKPKPKEDIDWNMVRYNSFYKSSEFFESKFPNGMLAIPGFDKIIEMMVEEAKSPLEEMELRQEQADEIIKARELELEKCPSSER